MIYDNNKLEFEVLIPLWGVSLCVVATAYETVPGLQTFTWIYLCGFAFTKGDQYVTQGTHGGSFGIGIVSIVEFLSWRWRMGEWFDCSKFGSSVEHFTLIYLI